jgi:hypothetical protein
MKYNKTMIKIISVDDHEMISLGLERVFSETSDIRLCHLCKTNDEAKAFISSPPLKNLIR